MDIEQLKALKAIEELGTISAAARQVGLSQPGLSRLVARAEQELGVTLFHRSRAGAAPTVEGRAVLEFASRTLSEYQALIESVGGWGTLAGVVKVVASTTPGEYLLPALVAGFNEAYEAVTVETRITDSAAVPDEIRAGRAHVGFAGTLDTSVDLVHRPIARDEVVLAVPAAHEFAERGEIEVAEIAGHRLLIRESGSGTHATVLNVLKAHGLGLPEHFTSMTLGSTNAVLSAVDAGFGIGFVTARALSNHDPSRVFPVRLAGVPIVRDLYLVYQAGVSRAVYVQAFIDHVEQSAGSGDSALETG